MTTEYHKKPNYVIIACVARIRDALNSVRPEIEKLQEVVDATQNPETSEERPPEDMWRLAKAMSERLFVIKHKIPLISPKQEKPKEPLQIGGTLLSYDKNRTAGTVLLDNGHTTGFQRSAYQNHHSHITPGLRLIGVFNTSSNLAICWADE